MRNEIKLLSSQMTALQEHTDDLNLLSERDELVSVGVENFNAYNIQYSEHLKTVTIPEYSNLEVGKEGLKQIIKDIKDKILKLIRSVLGAISTMTNKFTSFTGMMLAGLKDLEDQIKGGVVFDEENRVDYNKLNDMCFLDGKSVKKSIEQNIANIRFSYNESLGDVLKPLHDLVKTHTSYLKLKSSSMSGFIDVLEYNSIMKTLNDITSDRYGTPLKATLEKKINKKDAKFVHYAVFRTSKEVRLLLLDFKKSKKNKLKKIDVVQDKLKIVDAEASRIINRDNPFSTLSEKDIEELLTLAIKSMSEYDAVDVESAIKKSINDIHERIADTKSTKTRVISNLSVVVNYYGYLMKYSASYIYKQHRMNYRSLKFLVHLSGD